MLLTRVSDDEAAGLDDDLEIGPLQQRDDGGGELGRGSGLLGAVVDPEAAAEVEVLDREAPPREAVAEVEQPRDGLGVRPGLGYLAADVHIHADEPAGGEIAPPAGER